LTPLDFPFNSFLLILILSVGSTDSTSCCSWHISSCYSFRRCES
jgi:hypothetical protein